MTDAGRDTRREGRDAEALDLRASSAVPHLILVGLPGVGKSTVGAGVAERLGRPFLDFDVEIERRTGCSVARLFAERGEAHFRALERALTEELRHRPGMVLAPGGGWVGNPANVALLRPPGRIIYLRVSPETALRRLGAGRDDRPLLAVADPLAALHRLLAERARHYESADGVIDTELFDTQGVADSVVALAAAFRVG
jgi:shikimate kinase